MYKANNINNFRTKVTMDVGTDGQGLITMSNTDLAKVLMQPPPSTTPSFMHNFDVELVGAPGQSHPEKFQKGIHPEWTHSYGQMIFVEPTNPQPLALAYWDFNFQG